MRRILLIAKRDYIASVQTKGFLFGLLIAPLLFGGGFIGIALMKQQPDLTVRQIALLDRSGVAADAIVRAATARNRKDAYDKNGRQTGAIVRFEVVQPEADVERQRLELSNRVRRREIAAFLEVEPNVLSAGEDDSAVRYYTNASGIDTLRYWFNGPVNEGLRRVRLARLGLDETVARELMRGVSVDSMSLVEKDAGTGSIQRARKRGELEGFGVPYGLVMMLGMIVLMGSSPMLTAVTQDKTQRVVEMLLGVATPSELMIGKVLSGVAVSLTSSAFYVVGATMMLSGLGMSGLIPFGLLPWFYVYLIADVAMLCAFATALGAACSTPQEAQGLAIVLTTPVIIPFFLLMPVLNQPNGPMATFVSFLPPLTPMLMLLRQSLSGGVPAWQPWVGLLGILVWAAAFTWASSRIFRVGILMQGKAPKLPELVRWIRRG